MTVRTDTPAGKVEHFSELLEQGRLDARVELHEYATRCHFHQCRSNTASDGPPLGHLVLVRAARPSLRSL